ADGITVHLREDRRHIQDRDLRVLKETVTVKLNLELACAEDVLRIATEICPEQATLVPEKREEVTTEGGLDVVGNLESVQHAVQQLKNAGIVTSLFLDPDAAQIEAAAQLGVEAVELHTGQYALARGEDITEQLVALTTAARQIRESGMLLHAGHGLNYQNVKPIAQIPDMHELNIGHSIISRAVMVGMTEAVRDMKRLVE
ncbi:MAG TPA: pyridoxine 5'-phosphate synthase, partial [Planctomycetaceae bacterium]|nr:pyridoxine 5'-phosphate synthase [Planctomycetaceae bacterium]